MAEPRQVERPLSPHLQIYRFTITMTMSILHRITGGALYFGTLLLAAWLIAVASGPDAYASFQSVAGSVIGRLVMFGYTWALLHHLFSGIRHFFWDTIHGFDLKTADLMSWGALILALICTLLVWTATYHFGGTY